MNKQLASLWLAAILSFNFSTAAASEVTTLRQGESILEIGTSPNAKVSGSLNGQKTDAKGKSGFKATFTYALDDNWEFQYRKTMFDSKEASVSLYNTTLASTASVDLNDYNFRYKLNDRHKLVVGLENSRIAYDNYVRQASHNSLHIGIDSEYPLSKNVTAFTKHVWGHNTSDQEYGLLFDISKRETISLSYISRKTRLPVSLFTRQINPAYEPVLGSEINLADTDYKMTGISLMYGLKL